MLRVMGIFMSLPINPNPLVTPRGLRYSIIYLLVFILPFLIMNSQTGMTAILVKTFSFLTLPLALAAWLLSPDFFHSHYWLLIALNIALDLLLLLWIGRAVKKKNNLA